MKEEKPDESKYQTLIQGFEHHTLLSALLYYKSTQEYMTDKEAQKHVDSIVEKVKKTVRETHAREKANKEPEKYSDLTFDKFMDDIKNNPPPKGKKQLKLNAEERLFTKIMVDNCVVGTLVFDIKPEKMIDILNFIASAYKRSMDGR